MLVEIESANRATNRAPSHQRPSEIREEDLAKLLADKPVTARTDQPNDY